MRAERCDQDTDKLGAKRYGKVNVSKNVFYLNLIFLIAFWDKIRAV